jgi:AcrR family transcriptional regulator
MENIKNKKTAQAETDKAAKIQEAYIDYVLENGHEPPSVYQFMKKLRMKEATFYEHFNSFTALQKEIWREYFNETLKRIQSDQVYPTYSVREKLLAFYFTWIELLKANRSYVMYCLKTITPLERDLARNRGTFLAGFKQDFLDYANELLAEGKESNEIVERPLISKMYDEGLWRQLLFVLNFWVRDDSQGFEQTDAAIEKAVNLSFDVMGRGAVDAAIDLARFLYQKR